MAGKKTRRAYRSYLLRLWQVTSGGRATWRASLECPHTGRRTGFASLEALFRYLEDRTDDIDEGLPPCGREEGGEPPLL